MSFLDLSPSPEPSEAKTDATWISKSKPKRSPSMIDRENEMANGAKSSANIPKHPIATMQGAFAESFLESTAGLGSPLHHKVKSAAERRHILLEQDASDETHAARWKLKPGQQFHEFWKLMAQISFGVYLLLNGIARDEDQVMKILQVHVDEVDEFLETTLEDFSAAQEDIEERLKYLKLPLKNISTFDTMLEDRVFRRNIVEGNEKIEHIISRTALAMNDALKDVRQGAESCRVFSEYLAAEQNNSLWKDRPNLRKVYEAMKGNVDGWCKALASLRSQGNYLDTTLVQLSSIVSEIDRRAGEVSRRTRFSAKSSSRSSAPSPNTLSIHDSRNSRQKHSSSGKGQKSNNHVLPTHQLNTFESIPEIESDSPTKETNLREPDLILKPHTYTPVPSPSLQKPKSAFKPEPIMSTSPSVTEIGRRTSLRKRFSLSRKNQSNIKEEKSDSHTPRQSTNARSPNNKGNVTFFDHHTPNILTPPSRDSDTINPYRFEESSPRKHSHNKNHQESTVRQSNEDKNNRNPTSPSRLFSQIPQVCNTTTCRNSSEPSPLLTPMTIKIPEQQYFRPVNASPHSPLQRPWTASPSQNPLHAHPNSSSSNISNFSSYSRRNVNGNSRLHSRTPSTMRNLSSAMGMSVQSEMTEKGLRKKRSMFGWLKEQFSLSEEEREMFEEKRRHGEMQRMKIDMIEREKALGRKIGIMEGHAVKGTG